MGISMRFFFSFKMKTDMKMAFQRLRMILWTQFNIITRVVCVEPDRLQIRTSAPATPWQNGHAEASARLVKEKGRAMMLDAKLPDELWPETYRNAVYLLNRTPIQTAQGWRTPYELWWSWMRIFNPSYQHLPFDLRPRLSHLRVYGCVAYPMTKQALERIKSNHHIGQFEKKAHMGYLIGYRASTQYIIWIPSLGTKKLIRSANVRFDETKLYSKERERKTQQEGIYIDQLLADAQAEEVTFEYDQSYVQEAELNYDSSIQTLGDMITTQESDQGRQRVQMESQKIELIEGMPPPSPPTSVRSGISQKVEEQRLSENWNNQRPLMPPIEINEAVEAVENNYDDNLVVWKPREIEIDPDQMDIGDYSNLGKRTIDDRSFDYEFNDEILSNEEHSKRRRLNAIAMMNALKDAVQRATGLNRHIDNLPTPPRNYREAIHSKYKDEWL